MATSAKTLLRSFGLSVLAVIFSVFTVVFAGGPLLTLRNLVGRIYYVLFTAMATALLVSTGKFEIWLPFLTIAMLVFVYSELEEHQVRVLWSGAISLMATLGMFALIILYISKSQSIQIFELVTTRVELVLDQIKNVQPNFTMDVSTVVSQLPSVLIIGLLLSLWIALIQEPSLVRRLSGISHAKALIKKRNLSNFVLPDAFIWICLLAIIGSFVDFENQTVQVVATNVLNVVMLLYFFQGTAVVATFMRSYRVSVFWQALVYFIMFIQLFIFVSAIGLMDYWFEFRRKMTKKSAQPTREV